MPEPWREVRWARDTAHLLASCPLVIRRGERLLGSPPPGGAVDSPPVAAWRPHLVLDLPHLLANGLDRVVSDLDCWREDLRLLDPKRPEKAAFYQAGAISLAALQGFIERHAVRARELAASEPDVAWRHELQAAAAACDRIAHEPARTLRETLQLIWFAILGADLDCPEPRPVFSPGRLDQVLLPAWQAAVDARSAELDDLDELLDQFHRKLAELSEPGSPPATLAVGGRRSDGRCAANALSVRVLRSLGRVGLREPRVAVLWHDRLPAEVLDAAADLLRQAPGVVSFYHGEVIIQGLRRHGLPSEHAVDHVPGCHGELVVAGRSNPGPAGPLVNLPLALLAALNGGRHPANGDLIARATAVPGSWSEVLDALDAQLEHAAHAAVAEGIEQQALARRHRPLPLASILVQGCVEHGLDLNRGGALYSFLQPQAVGIGTVVDALAAVRTLVFDEERVGYAELLAALAADWVGHDRLLAAARACPRLADGAPLVAGLFAYVAGSWCDHVEGCRNAFGGAVLPGFLAGHAAATLGAATPATPDGRRAGEPFEAVTASAQLTLDEPLPPVYDAVAGLDQARVLGGIEYTARCATADLTAPDRGERLGRLLAAAFSEADLYMLQVELDERDGLQAV